MKHYLLFLINTLFSSLPITAQTGPSIEELRPQMLESAMAIGKDYGVTLDYSEASIAGVEQILGEVHREYIKSNNGESLKGIALIFSFYIVAVIEKHHGKGRLERDHEVLGKNMFSFYLNGQALFPYGWCLKRIFDGEEDDVAVTYRVLVLEGE